MSFLLDTMVVSETVKRDGRRDERVRAWLAATASEATYLSVASVCELAKGIERLKQRDEDRRADRLERWFRGVLVTYSERMLLIDAAVAEQWGHLLAGTPTRPVLDALLAATAAVHSMTVVTRNIDHFAGTGVEVLNPYAPDPA